MLFPPESTSCRRRILFSAVCRLLFIVWTFLASQTDSSNSSGGLNQPESRYKLVAGYCLS